MAHPLHGIKPQAEKVRQACSDWSDRDAQTWLWKLQRKRSDGFIEVHPTAGDRNGPTYAGTGFVRPGTRQLRPGPDVRAWFAPVIQADPGWEIVVA